VSPKAQETAFGLLSSSKAVLEWLAATAPPGVDTGPVKRCCGGCDDIAPAGSRASCVLCGAIVNFDSADRSSPLHRHPSALEQR
jgi:hypothetical protein